MIKIALQLFAVLALSCAFVLHSERAQEGCQSEDELWGSQDGTKFYFCLPGTNKSIEQSCPAGTFFVKNATVSGCLPLAMVDSNCIYTNVVEPPDCTGAALKQPQPSSDPTKFYLCQAENAPAVKLSCGEGQAFMKQNGYLGCFNWTEWREVKNCPE